MSDNNPKLFLAFREGISEETNEETITQHFSNYGEVVNSLIIRRKNIAFVTFADPLMAKNALEDEAKARISDRKIFVGGLATTITLEEFQEYFGQFGTMLDSVLIYDKVSNNFRGFGFVTYESEEAAKDVLRQRFHNLNDKMVEVKKAKAKQQQENNNHNNMSYPYYASFLPPQFPVPQPYYFRPLYILDPNELWGEQCTTCTYRVRESEDQGRR
ncbi:hypothetical protein COLO4_11617 [Corchorus olitorius]|uniref:RRM domain-containing protein n=1 Tax=Corchorus olitorius TaxID=93759 RepID=A0A1R3K3S8_9ROSI|nr:hypothetical protein COLO4_11617 [Corchorus olitorius]